MSDWRVVVHYRNRAELLRAIAKEITHKEHCKALSEAAELYDSMADGLERAARSEPGEFPGRKF